MAGNITTGTVTTSMKASTRPVISRAAISGGAVARQPGITAETKARTDADDGCPVGRAS